jgi:hypothetical protein
MKCNVHNFQEITSFQKKYFCTKPIFDCTKSYHCLLFYCKTLDKPIFFTNFVFTFSRQC